MTNELEKIYYELAKILSKNLEFKAWDRIDFASEILQNDCSGLTFSFSKSGEVNFFEVEFEDVFLLSEKLVLLRDLVLKNTGDRIWSVIFTLHSDGKFTTEYDYEKPENYEETEGVITGDEINKTLLKW